MAKQLESVAAMACMTVLLMLFNFVFCCTGLLMLGLGIWMKIELHDYAEFCGENSSLALLALSFLGALVALIGVFACCCTTRQHPALLYVYGAFLAVIALLELGAGASVYTYRNTLVEGFDRTLNESIVAYGTDKTKTFHIDLMQNTLQCCGNRAYTDWRNASPPKVVPNSCCKVGQGECDITNVDEDINTEGCYNRVIDFIKNNMGLVAGGALGVAVFPMLGVFLACCLASYINKIRSDDCRQLCYRADRLAGSHHQLMGGGHAAQLRRWSPAATTTASSNSSTGQRLELVLDLRRLQLRSLNNYDASNLPPSRSCTN